jgi:thioesterase domain-containing protein
MRAPLRVLGVRWAGDPGGLTVGELAAVHVERIRTVQPDGPYLLAGWSFGGVLAFEVARQLVAEGSAVEFVGMLDANPLRDPITGLPPRDTGYLSLLVKVLDDLERREVADEEPVDAAEFADEAAWARLMGATPAGLPVRHVRRYLALARDNMRAVIGYEPRCYPGDVDLFQAADVAPEAQRDLAADLRRVVAGEVRITPAPGDHAGMLTGPQAGVLASLVDEALERSRKAGK